MQLRHGDYMVRDATAYFLERRWRGGTNLPNPSMWGSQTAGGAGIAAASSAALALSCWLNACNAAGVGCKVAAI
jgi:hypothetical protein